MSAADGYVVGLTKIHDNGPAADRWNLVIVSEGYTAAQISDFQADAQDLVDHMFETAPFDEQEVACAINVYRLEVVSNESGADDPACGGAGAGTTATTYFDATYCADGVIRRLLSGDSALAQTTVEAHLPEWDQIVVLVNAPTRGGAGGSIAWLANSSWDWMDVFLHELGHAAFDLADEYDCYSCNAGETGHDNYTGGEPAPVNVTAEPDPALVKWSALVTAGPASPTMANPNCANRNTGASPEPPGTVGTFEGAYYYHCGAYRPQYDCKMRVSAHPDWCAVCQGKIRETLSAYSVPAADGSVAPDSLSVEFIDIPEGTTAIRAAVFTINSCWPVTLEVIGAPAAPFGIHGTPLVVSRPEGGPVRKGRVWFSYACGNPGDSANDTAEIRCVETGESWVFDLDGNCVERPTAAVQLVLDRSGSMLGVTSEGRTKEQVLQDSAGVLVNVAYEDTGVGINTYDHDAQPVMDVTDLGDTALGLGRMAARNALTNYAANPNGLTAIGDGIELGHQKLTAAVGYDVSAMIVLTDGIETAEKRIADVADTIINEYVYAIGLGTAEQIRPAALQALTNGTGGYLLMTGNLSVDDTYLLAKYYLQILAGITNNDIILDPEGWLAPGDRIRIPFDVNEADIEITGVVLSTMPSALRFALETPDGDFVDFAFAQTDPQIDFAYNDQTIHARATLPVVHDGREAGAGRWHLVLAVDSKVYQRLSDQPERQESQPRVGVSYSANVLTYSNLRMDAGVSQDSQEPGAKMRVRARITEYGGPFGGSAQVFAEVLLPDGTEQILTLSPLGDGVYQGAITATQSGIYRFRIRAIGTTSRDRPFTREQTRTGAVWAGGDQPDGGGDRADGGEPTIRDLLCCLYRGGGVRPEFLDRLKELGIDPDVLLKCLERFCDGERHEGPFSMRALGLDARTVTQIAQLLKRLQ